MAVPALKFEPENLMEERIARIETSVEHIQADVSDLKIGVRRLNDKIDGVDQRLTIRIDAGYQKLNDKIDTVDQKLNNKIDAFSKEVMAALQKLNVSRWVDRTWQLTALGGVFYFIARGFKWI